MTTSIDRFQSRLQRLSRLRRLFRSRRSPADDARLEIRHGSLRPLVPITAWAVLVVCLAGCSPLGLETSPGDPRTSSKVGAAGTPTVAEAEKVDTIVVTIEGRSITLDDLHEHMQDQFLEEFLRQPEDEIYEMQENAVRDLVQRHVIDRAAAERGITSEALFQEITGAGAEPSEEDVARWYSLNQSRLRGARLEDVAVQIKEMLVGTARKEAWDEFVSPRIEDLDWEMRLEPPRAQLAATRLIRGPTDAPVTIMTFSDYQCPYCVRSEPVLAEVLARYPKRVRVVHRHFPLDNIHSFARPASEAAMCADEQGKFWEFHDAIFARMGSLEKNSFREIGAEIGLGEDALETCIEERRYSDFVQADFDAGQKAGVTGTPAFFVNGIALKGARDADALSRVVDSELERIQAN